MLMIKSDLNLTNEFEEWDTQWTDAKITTTNTF